MRATIEESPASGWVSESLGICAWYGGRLRSPGRRSRQLPWLAVMTLVALLVIGCRRTSTVSFEPLKDGLGTPVAISVRTRTLQALWSAVNENYIFRQEIPSSWESAVERYQSQIAVETSAADFALIVQAMLDELPPEAVRWQSREERIAQARAAATGFEGIGAFVAFRQEPEPHIVLLSIIPGSPAERAGLAAHDSIYAIDGSPIGLEEGLEAVSRIRGPADSQVRLTVGSPGAAPRDVTVTRGIIVGTGDLEIGTISNTEIGYILFPPAVYEQLNQDVLDGLYGMTGEGERQLEGLILDLRIARAGQEWPLLPLLTLFADGDLGEMYSLSERQEITVEGQDVLQSQSVPLVVLVGPDTQGAPEIFAAALQGIGRARVIGVPTLGVVEQMGEYPLPDGSVAMIATGSYRSAAGRELGLEGLLPEERIDADWDEVTKVNDPLVVAAVLWIRRAGE